MTKTRPQQEMAAPFAVTDPLACRVVRDQKARVYDWCTRRLGHSGEHGDWAQASIGTGEVTR